MNNRDRLPQTILRTGYMIHMGSIRGFGNGIRVGKPKNERDEMIKKIFKKGRVTVYFIETILETIRDAQGFACKGSMGSMGSMVSASSV